MPVTIKAIVPSRLGLLAPGAATRAVNEAGEEAAHRAVDKLKAFTRTWRHKPTFTISKRGFTWKVTTDDEVFFYQDEGTDGPYAIRPRRKRALYWRGARHPVRVVRHPGLTPQDYTGQVQREMRRVFKELMDEELRAAQG